MPTVAQPAQHADSGAPWQEQTRTAGAALRDDPGHRGLAVPR